MKRTIIVFDLDGTLNQTHLFAVAAHNIALKKMGFPETDLETVMPTVGSPWSEFVPAIAKGIKKEDMPRYLQLLDEANKETIDGNAAPYDGVPDLLRKLRADGLLTGVCTNAKRPYIEPVLKGIGVESLIDYTQGLEDGLPNKGLTLRKLIATAGAERAIMVGDTLYDKKAADDNGIPFIGCRYGYRPAEMEGLPYVADTPADIYPLVRSLLSGNE